MIAEIDSRKNVTVYLTDDLIKALKRNQHYEGFFFKAGKIGTLYLEFSDSLSRGNITVSDFGFWRANDFRLEVYLCNSRLTELKETGKLKLPSGIQSNSEIIFYSEKNMTPEQVEHLKGLERFCLDG